VYAEGEALLGWLNATVRLESKAPFDGNAAVRELATKMQAALHGSEVAHLKMTLTPDEGNDLAVLNLVRTDGSVELSHTLAEPLDAGTLIINARAEVDPAILADATLGALGELSQARDIKSHIEHMEHFRPSKPNPTHRMATA
jgi:hypothetical protein